MGKKGRPSTGVTPSQALDNASKSATPASGVKVKLKLASPREGPALISGPTSPLFKKIRLLTSSSSPPKPAKHADAIRPEEKTKLEPKKEKKIDKSPSFDLVSVNQALLSHLKSSQLATDDGRDRTELFHTLPSKKHYPDYYQIISEPECLKGIQQKVAIGKIASVDSLLERYRLLFSNAKVYNAPESQVYQDANILLNATEAYLASQRQEESADKRVAKRKKQAKEQQKAAIVPKYHAKQEEMAPLFEATELDQVDLFKKQYASFSDGRLDVNAVYPSNHNSQWSLVHCAAYFGSCDMLVYLVDECDGDVERQDPVHLGTALAWAAFGNQLKATKLLISRYKSVMSVKNAQGLTPLDLYLSSTDGEAESQWRSVLAFPPGWSFDRHRLKLALSEVMMLKSGKRKVADLFLSLPLASDYPDYYSIIKKPMCLNQIMSKIMTEASYSISSFVTDFERLIYNARLYNEPSSIVYQDTLLLREAIIYWLGTAYSSHYARIQLAQEDDGGRGGEEDRIDITTPSKTQPSLSMEEYVQNGIVYLPGDTVLISDPTKPSPLKPTVLQIVKFWRNRKEESLMTGMWYLYPEQTFHLPSRKFYETEIFKTKALHEHPASHIIRKCAILPWSEYRKGCPEGVLPEDVFVCDFRYSETGRMIERIRDWEKVTKLDLSRYGKLIPWSVPRNPVRTVHSIFYDPSTAAKSGEENAMLKKAHPAYSSQPYGTKSPLPQHQLPTRPYYQHSPMKASFQQPSPLPAHSLSQQQSSDLLSRPHISSADEARVPFKCRVNRIMIRSYPSLASSYDQKQIFSLTFDPPVYPYTSKTIAPAGMDCLYLFVDKSWRNDPRNEAEANEQAGDSPALPFKNIARGGWSFTEMVFHNAETRIPPMALPSAEVGTATLWSDDWLCFPILLQKGANLIELFTVNQPPAQPKTGQVVIEGDKHVQLSFRLFVIKTPNMAS